MYKIMIVDDEQLTRSFLKNIIPKLSPEWQVVGEASDGTEACLLLEAEHYDLVITDIKMPIMDGIALCEAIYHNFPHILVVILSGYGEFEYAKKAIKFNVSNYLLKPIVNSELKTMLEDITSFLNQKKSSDLEYLKLIQLSSRYKEDISTNLLQAIISQSHIQIKSLFPLLYQLDINLMDEEGVILLIQQSYNLPHSGNFVTNTSITKLLIYQTTLQLLKGTNKKVFLDSHGSTLIYLPLSQDDNLRKSVFQIHNAVNSAFEQTLPNELNTYVGSLETDILQLYLSYENAKSTVFQAMFSAKRTPVTFYNDSLSTCLIEQLQDLLTTLVHALKSHDTITTKLITDNLLEFRNQHLASWAMKHFYIYVLEYLCQSLSLENLNTLESADLSKSIKLIETFINKPLLDNQDENKLVSQVKDYILKHYDQPISLSLIADVLSVSPSYLSNLFHVTVGQSYVKYLTDVRMKQASLLLLSDKSMTLEEISKKVGYISVKHFSFVFKKHFNKTTSEYKKG